VAPLVRAGPAPSRHRLNPGGDRQANHALWRMVFTRMGSHPATRAYVERRTKEGKSKAEISLDRHATYIVAAYVAGAGR
jgi:transposase